MNKSIFVVTNPENGWDCVSGVYEADNEEDIKQFIADQRGLTLEELEDNDDIIVHEVHTITRL